MLRLTADGIASSVCRRGAIIGAIVWFPQALPGDNDSILCFFLKVPGAGDTEGEGWGDHGGVAGLGSVH